MNGRKKINARRRLKAKLNNSKDLEVYKEVEEVNEQKPGYKVVKMKDLNKIVVEMIEEHEGGEVFFNNLDEAMKNKSIITSLFHMIEDYPYNIILSGKFGLYLSNKFVFPREYFLVNGGLRKGKKIISLEPNKEGIKGNEFIFLDDSFYSGKTRNAIRTEIEKWGGTLTNTYVCYDGAKEKDETVKSLYRYYDNFKGETV
jgi:hypothetical protein